jgi:hypothetical protein
MRSFFPPHIILGVGKQRDLENKICQTVGDAQWTTEVDSLHIEINL